jgi:AcrR family transcriptional regulator
MRADARANRARILAAAEDVFGESGAQASTEEVARRAGVGIGTVFRHFPTKRDLVEATLIRHFDQLANQAAALAEHPDPGAALRELVTAMVGTGVSKVSLANQLVEPGELPDAATQAASRLGALVEVVLQRAQVAGSARADLTVDELIFLVSGLTQAAAARPVPAGTLDRAVAVVLAGLTP